MTNDSESTEAVGTIERIRPCTLASIRDLGAIPVWSGDTGPSAARVLGVSRDLAYRMARDGQLPTIIAGSRRLVPVPPLRRMLGDLS